MVLRDFEPLGVAEQKLVDWLKAGNRGMCQISETLPQIESDQVRLRASLLRYLALGGCDDCRLPKTGLRIWGAWIAGDDVQGFETPGLDLEGASLPADLAFVACHFPDPVILQSTRLKNLYLNDSRLVAGLDGDRLRAEGGVTLRGVEAGETIRLGGARIEGDLSCSGARLNAPDHALFADAMRVDGGVFLRDVQAVGTIRFLGARIGDNLELSGAQLACKRIALSLDAAVIGGSLFLRDGARFAGTLALSGTVIADINDERSSWPPRIELDRCRYGAFLGRDAPLDAKSRIEWLSRIENEPGRFRPDAYEHCAKVLREMGHGADARQILIEKERLHFKARRERVAIDLRAARAARDGAPKVAGLRPHSDRVIALWWQLLWLQVWNAILAAFVGYGRKPQNAALWGAGLLVIGWLVFGNAAGHGAIKPNLPQVQLNRVWTGCADDPRGQLACFMANPEAASYPRFNAFIYSADALVPVVSLEMQSYWIPDDRTDRGMLARAYLWFHISMGWALTLLAVAGFSGLIKTDSK